jgi:hypothetical protein
MSDLSDRIEREARLIILRELVEQMDGRLNSISLAAPLDNYGIRRDRDWIATQLRKLEALGAIELMAAGTVLVAHITEAGRNHVAERGVIEGVMRPSDFG